MNETQTIPEIENIVKEIRHIQSEYMLAYGTSEQRELSRRWKAAHRRADDLGFKVRHIGPRGGAKEWIAVPKPSQPGNWIRDDHEKKHNNECTTRAIYFCLDHKVPYWTIRERQNRRAQTRYGIGRCSGWNREEVWGGILSDNGFVKISLPYRRITFGRMAEILSGIDAKVAIHTRGHLAACHSGNVVDDWDSRGKTVDFLYVRAEKAGEVKSALGV